MEPLVLTLTAPGASLSWVSAVYSVLSDYRNYGRQKMPPNYPRPSAHTQRPRKGYYVKQPPLCTRSRTFCWISFIPFYLRDFFFFPQFDISMSDQNRNVSLLSSYYHIWGLERTEAPLNACAENEGMLPPASPARRGMQSRNHSSEKGEEPGHGALQTVP